MKVLMLVGRLNVGGTETYIFSLAAALRKLGIEVGVAARGGPLVSRFRRSGIVCYRIPARGKTSAVAFLQKLAAQQNYGIVHAHDSSSFRWLTAWHGRSRPRFILSVHGKYLNRKALKMASVRADYVLPSSPEMRQWARRNGIPPGKTRLTPNGIDTLHFKPDASFKNKNRWKAELGMKAYDPLVVYAGRFNGAKHLVARKLILAAGRIRQAYPNAGIVLAGPGVYYPKLRRLAARINGKHKFVFVRGAMADIRRLYGAGDLVVGTGRVALEAMACGRPVLAVGVSGYSGPVTRQSMDHSIRNHFGDHKSGVQATTTRIAAGVIDILKRPHRLKMMGLTGRDIIVRRFSALRAARRMLYLYRQSVKP